MRGLRFIQILGISIAMLVGSSGFLVVASDLPSVPSKLPKEIQLAQTASKALRPPKAKTRVLLEQKLEGMPGFKVVMVYLDGPPGWVGGRHYHPGHIFGYILEGTYELNYEGMTSQTIRAGQAFYERPNTVMRSKNGSSTMPQKSIVFQIIREGEPVAVSVK